MYSWVASGKHGSQCLSNIVASFFGKKTSTVQQTMDFIPTMGTANLGQKSDYFFSQNRQHQSSLVAISTLLLRLDTDVMVHTWRVPEWEWMFLLVSITEPVPWN